MAMLEVKNLGISFGGLRAVDDFNLSIEQGQLYGLIGPNGAGKTTVFNMLTGVYAIERNQEACDLIEENKRKFGTPNIQVVHGLAPEAMGDLPVPTHAFIGGSAGNLKEIITCLLGKNPLIRLVINTVTLETMAEVSECLKALNLIEEETICVNVSRAKKLGAYHLMMGQNPIYIVTCRGGGEV